jgi:hypothetical protein
MYTCKKNQFLYQEITLVRVRVVVASETSFLASILLLWCVFLMTFLYF